MDRDEKLVRAMGDLEEEEVISGVREMLADGVEPLHIVELCRKGFEVVGKRYEAREYFLSGLIISDDIFKSVLGLLESSGCFRPSEEEKTGKVVVGAPLGDVHDIGKGIISQLLRYSGFEVIDLGVNVRPADFLQAAAESGAEVLGISTLITTAYESLRETVFAFDREGLRASVKIMLGGGAVSQRVCEYAGADAWSRDAADAVRFARQFTGKE